MVDLEEMQLARGRYRIVMMNCGYVESSRTSWLIFSTFGDDERFDTAAQAVVELALDLHAKYEEEYMDVGYQSDCCKRERAASAAAKFCPQCGTRMSSLEFDSACFMDFVAGLHNTTCDSYGDSEANAKREFAFWPWRAEELLGASRDEVVFIAENAERVVYDALCEVKPELRDDDVVDGDEWRSSAWMEVRRRGSNGT